MRTIIRAVFLALLTTVVLVCAGRANADSFQLTYSGVGVNGFLNLTANPLGGGLFQVTSISGTENGTAIAGMVGGSGANYFWLPDGSGYLYDNYLTPGTSPVVSNPGLLFALLGSTYPENIYWGGGSYLEASYLGGGNFPQDFNIVPISLQVTATPEPSTLALLGAGLFALGGIIKRRQRKQEPEAESNS
ncbi:MAG TPA: PEP-CTERM sorting domain-containing protein [Terriglobales bacterium]|nr:PEP-CTERM sorting domain-containing protein [Terriglobales bacterium]